MLRVRDCFQSDADREFYKKYDIIKPETPSQEIAKISIGLAYLGLDIITAPMQFIKNELDAGKKNISTQIQKLKDSMDVSKILPDDSKE